MRSRVRLLRARAAWIAAAGVVGDDQGVLVDQSALEARVGAHVLAHLLPQEARVAVSSGAIEQHPEGVPRRHVEGDYCGGQFPDGREVADEAEAGDQREGQPDSLLGALAQELVHAPRCLIQPHSRDAVTLDLAFGPHEDLGVDRLRAGVAAPEPASHSGEEEQGQGRKHQQRRQKDQVLRIKQQAEDVEALRLQIEQHGLAPAPLQPGDAVEQQLREPDEDPAPGGKPTGHCTRVDRRLLLVRRTELRAVVARFRKQRDGDDFLGA